MRRRAKGYTNLHDRKALITVNPPSNWDEGPSPGTDRSAQLTVNKRPGNGMRYARPSPVDAQDSGSTT